ncbi:MAG: hypothetical protein KBE27_05850 [Syntrophorhabdaceae bacterium]|nr:hypothetical protein [Syntrophorhabdales bacterium]MBP9561320.1 hypothetical protein [Syntrophorhabdaceae bacterium]
MKKVLMAFLVTMFCMVGFVYAQQPPVDTGVDSAFVTANEWLNKNNLTVTGSALGANYEQAFMQDAILVVGEAVAPAHITHPSQREIMAKRGAVVMAQRQLAEYLNGFAIVGDTLVKDGMTQYDVVRSAVAGLVKGAQVVVQEYNKEKDMAIAILKLGMHGPKSFASTLYEKMFSDPNLKKELRTDKPTYRGKPVPIEDKYDGLIVDASEQNFRPALINRIFTSKGEVLYDPAKISQKVLVEQGCGEYTNSVEKAKAVLNSRGVNNPMIVKASGTVSPSDLQVSAEDAAKIYTANQKTGFFAAAKVAFVLR